MISSYRPLQIHDIIDIDMVDIDHVDIQRTGHLRPRLCGRIVSVTACTATVVDIELQSLKICCTPTDPAHLKHEISLKQKIDNVAKNHDPGLGCLSGFSAV